MRQREYFVYIMCNKSGTLYTGATNNLTRRAYEHKEKLFEGFTKKYNISRLVYYESYPDVRDAIAREKQIKAWRRSKKLDIIRSVNPYWRDLLSDWDDLQAHPDWGRSVIPSEREPVLSECEGNLIPSVAREPDVDA